MLGDRVQLKQVLQNVIKNGIEAMTTVANRPRLLWVEGLSISRSLVENHSGRLWRQSDINSLKQEPGERAVVATGCQIRRRLLTTVHQLCRKTG